MKAILAIASALLVTIAWLVHATTSPSASAPAATAAAEPAPPARHRVPRSGAPLLAPDPPLAAPALRDEPDLSIRGQRMRLEDRFAAERSDPAWATTAQQELHADLGRFATREVGVRDVQCRASMCRIELALANRDAASTFMESWLRARTWTGAGVADNEVVGSDGQPRLVLFVGKDGIEL